MPETANVEGALEKTEELGSRILQFCIAQGGTITGEHGVGVEKIGEMCVQFSDLERAQFHAIRDSFDPHGIMNPGKAIPTLARCAEFETHRQMTLRCRFVAAVARRFMGMNPAARSSTYRPIAA